MEAVALASVFAGCVYLQAASREPAPRQVAVWALPATATRRNTVWMIVYFQFAGHRGSSQPVLGDDLH
jgi:hypothetical protein